MTIAIGETPALSRGWLNPPGTRWEMARRRSRTASVSHMSDGCVGPTFLLDALARPAESAGTRRGMGIAARRRIRAAGSITIRGERPARWIHEAAGR